MRAQHESAESRSRFGLDKPTLGALAEWLRSGLQSRLRRFDSGRRLRLGQAIQALLCAFGARPSTAVPQETGGQRV